MKNTKQMHRYYIRAEFFYYSGTFNAPEDGALRDHYGDRIEFSSRAEAESYLTEERSEWEPDTMGCSKLECGKFSFDGTYYTTHGEYSRPVYTILKVPARATLAKAEGGK